MATALTTPVAAARCPAGDIMLQSLKFVSLNCHGFNQGSEAIKAFCDSKDLDIDIIFLQELWLSPDAFVKIETFSENYICYGKSAMDLAVRSSVLKGRPFGGVCLLIKSCIANMVRYSKVSDRYSLIIIENYLIVSVYFPTINSDFDLCIAQSMLADIEEVFISFPGLNIICGGDFNANLDNLVGRSTVFSKFMHDCQLIPTNKIIASNIDYTFCQETLQRYSYIDYFLIDNDLKSELLDFKILDLAVNHSDHNILYMELGCTVVSKRSKH